MPTTVQIELLVDEKGAVQGVRTFNASLQGSKAEVNQLDATLQRLNEHLDKIANRAPHMQKIGEHAISSLDKVRLLRDDIGIRIPRAMEKVIAKSPALMAAISGVGQALIGIGAVEIGVTAFKGIYDESRRVWDSYLSLTKAQDDYNEALEKARKEDFGNTRSIEDTRLRIEQATDAVKSFADAAEATRRGAWGEIFSGLAQGNLSGAALGVSQLVTSHKFKGTSVESQAEVDKLTVRAEEDLHRTNEARIEAAHALDGELQGRRKITAELAKQRALNSEDRRHNTALSSIVGNPVSPNSGAEEERLKNAAAAGEAAAQQFTEDREHAIAVRHLWEQADEARLHGSELYAAQESSAIADLHDKQMDSASAVAAVRARFHNEDMKRFDQEKQRIDDLKYEAAASGATGLEKLSIEHDQRMNKIRNNKDLSPTDQAVAFASENTIYKNQRLQEEEIFTDRVNALADQRAEHAVSGFARIALEAQRQIDQLKRDFEKEYGKPGSADYMGHATELGRGVEAIRMSANDQRSELALRNAEETSQIEDAARAHSLAAEKNQTKAIIAEYQARVDRWHQQLVDQEISEQDYNRRAIAAAQLRDAEIVEEAKQAHAKLASEFDSIFRGLSHPMDLLKEEGERAAASFAATLTQKIQGTWEKQHGAGAQSPASKQSGFWNKVLGHTPQEHTAASSIAVQSATIHVGQAAITFGGSTTSATSSGSGGFGPGGFTGGAGGGSSSADKSTMSGAITDSDVAALAGSTGPNAGGGYSTNYGAGSVGDDGTDAANTASGIGGGGAAGWLGGEQANQDASKGAQIGGAVGGPWGAAAGAAIGAGIGIWQAREAARVYWLKQTMPRLSNDLSAFQTGTMDYLSAFSDMQSADFDAKKATDKMGLIGRHYYQSTMKGNIAHYEAKLTQESRAGRADYGPSTASYDVGTDYVPRTGYALIHKGERIPTTDQNERITRALEAGADTSIARATASYRSQMQMPVGRTVNHHYGDMHLHAIDTRSGVQFLMANRHAIRSALNQSFADNSGGADA